MKVIKKGRAQKGWAKEKTCTGDGNGDGGCGAVLLVEESDLGRTQSGHYDGSIDYYVTFVCPECGVWTDVNDYRGTMQDLPPLSRTKTQDARD
jgi:hypothetical protein